MIYEVEVEEQNQKRRHSPFRYAFTHFFFSGGVNKLIFSSVLSLQVECEYEESDLIRAKDLRSLHAVTNPPAVVAQGTIRVQMRLATGTGIPSASSSCKKTASALTDFGVLPQMLPLLPLFQRTSFP